MNAKEARKKAEQVLNVNTQESIKDVLNTITIQAHNGEFETNYYKSLTAPVLEYIREQGYTIDYISGYREEGYYKITW